MRVDPPRTTEIEKCIQTTRPVSTPPLQMLQGFSEVGLEREASGCIIRAVSPLIDITTHSLGASLASGHGKARQGKARARAKAKAKAKARARARARQSKAKLS